VEDERGVGVFKLSEILNSQLNLQGNNFVNKRER